MVSKTMKYVTAITYKWSLGWGRHLWGYEVNFIKRWVSDERKGGLSQSWAGWYVKMGSVGRKLRPETSTSVRMGDGLWKERCLYF